MATVAVKVTLDLVPLHKYERQILSGLSGGSEANDVRKAFKQMAVVYRAWCKERFSRYSRGGGDWAPLAESTKKRRRKGKSTTLSAKKGGRSRRKTTEAGTIAILYDTGTLIAGLDPTFNPAKGAIEEQIPMGIRVGFGGAARHVKGKGASIADIAGFHQDGGPNLPAREIVVEPPAEKQREFAGLLERALGSTWREATA